MKFDVVIGNPPYQADNHQQIYPAFYLYARDIAQCVELIFPIGWQSPKNANNLRLLNNADIKEDAQIVFINNKHNVFQNIAGAEWTNIIMWIKDYDNGLQGKQLILTEGTNGVYKHLNYETSQIEKPIEIISLASLVKSFGNFSSFSSITSARKPYGLSTDVISNTEKYGLEPLFDSRTNKNDFKIYCKSAEVKYAPFNYRLPKKTKSISKYKVFVAYAWGNMSEKTGLGGAFSDVIIASPNEICTESYLETGCFDDFNTAQKHAKYLMTKFLRALLYLNKFSQHSTTSWDAIPIQTYDEKWWALSIEEIDNHLMDKYKIPQDIKNFVFANIQTRSEKNIINYKE